jgi:predicted Zn-dependent peptidase
MSYGGATLAENLPAALGIFADVLQCPRLPEEELEACRQTVLQSLHSVEDEPSEKAMIELRRLFYPDPWGRSSLGEEDALETIGLKEIRDFVHSQFQPQGTILGIAGRVEWESLKDLVGGLFGDWLPANGAVFEEHPAEGGYLHVPYDSVQTHIGIAYSSVPYRHADYFRAWGAVGALGGGMSSRLFGEVREKRGLCYSVYASYHTLRDRAGVFCYAGTSAQRAQETLDVTRGELVRLAQGIDSGELHRLKARIKTELVMQQESSYSRASSIAREWYHIEHARTFDELQRIIDGLTCEDINEYLAANPPGDFTIVTVGPEELKV